MNAYEKLGVFYLGKEVDPDRGETTPSLLLYESKDLTTHAVCVGMTGSGKTGLCLSLLEEAALDKVPAILIDPKGDLGNLLLTFPELRAEDFRPWVDEGVALRKGMTPDEFAAKTADLWRSGLADWGQDGERIARLRDAADVAVYTPGGSAGLPIRVLRSFAAPGEALVRDAEAFQEKVAAAATGLLVLLGIDPDPVQSREHILLANILDRAWREGRSLNLAALIREVQTPPFDQVGVFDLESFFPSKERFALAMKLNNLLAAPGFAVWMEGEPLDIPRLLHTPEGKPRLSILSIAHLPDRERMFFVTTLLHEIVSWMRSQPGTSSLRAILYMDEIFGFFPPTANPPSKTPMLTLLKQARAYGLGVVLATQNPVDLDYKGLSNAGTWFLGRLQTERDKQRVIEGLEGASATSGQSFDRARIERILAGLKSRVFLMNNVHDDEPVLFHTRWAMSYLRGPLTRTQIAELMAPRKAAAAPAAASPPPPPSAGPVAVAPAAPPAPPSAEPPERPVLPPGITEVFLPSTGSSSQGDLLYRPALFGRARLHYASATAGVDEWQEIALISHLFDSVDPDPWESAEVIPARDLDPAPESTGRFATPPAEILKPRQYPAWGKSLAKYLYREHPLVISRCRELKAYSTPGETEGDFRARLAQTLHEKRDLALEKLRKKYAPKLARLKERIRTSEQRLEKEEEQLGHQKYQTALATGAALLGAIFGRKVASAGTIGRASTAMRSAGRVSREKQDIQRAIETLEANRQKLVELEETFQEEIDSVELGSDPEALELEAVTIAPRKSDITVSQIALAWAPWRVRPDGTASKGFLD